MIQKVTHDSPLAIFLDDQEVDELCRQRFREQFGAIYDDTYLFSRVWNGHRLEIQHAACRQLQTLGLDRVVKFEGDSFSNTLALSRGQKKRLALVAALLEDCSIYVFDEWAADQDAEWRRYFYRILLPEMKARGKLVIAITHDEGYDDVPDRTLHFRDVKIFCIDTQSA